MMREESDGSQCNFYSNRDREGWGGVIGGSETGRVNQDEPE